MLAGAHSLGFRVAGLTVSAAIGMEGMGAALTAEQLSRSLARSCKREHPPNREQSTESSGAWAQCMHM
jgi:hypothetical protein